MCAPLLGGQVRRPKTHDFFRRRVPEDELSVLIGSDQPLDHAIQHRLEHESLRLQGLPRVAQFFRLLSQVGRAPFLFGNVVQDRDPSAQVAPGVAEGPCRDFYKLPRLSAQAAESLTPLLPIPREEPEPEAGDPAGRG